MIAGAYAIVSFYMKLNSGLLAVLMVFLYLCIELWSHRTHRLQYLLSLVLFSIALWSSSFLLDTDFFPYLASGWRLIAFYSETMNSHPSRQNSPQIQAALLMIASIIICIGADIRKNGLKNLFLDCSTLAMLFFLFKTSFVREDLPHYRLFFAYLPLLMAPMLFFLKGLHAGITAIIVIVTCLVFSVENPTYRCEGRGWEYFREIALGEFLRPPRLPRLPDLPELQTVVGRDRVDSISESISYVYAEGIEYSPRPIVQSYAAYSEYLDDINRQHIRSPEGPRWLLFSNFCIDNRYCFFDESRTKQAILEKYNVHQRIRNVLILVRNDDRQSLEETYLGSGTSTLGQSITIPNGDIPIYFYSDIIPSWKGRLRTFFYQGPILRIKITLANGTENEFRVLRTLLEGGVLISRYVNSLDEAELFFKKKFSSLERVESISISSDCEWCMQPEFRYKFTTLSSPEKQ